ncbi:MAG TPA: hypothetical protein VIG49_12320 [Acetobacteraceae bacterium]|jgi:hypothetical protein
MNNETMFRHRLNHQAADVRIILDNSNVWRSVHDLPFFPTIAFTGTGEQANDGS